MQQLQQAHVHERQYIPCAHVVEPHPHRDGGGSGGGDGDGGGGDGGDGGDGGGDGGGGDGGDGGGGGGTHVPVAESTINPGWRYAQRSHWQPQPIRAHLFPTHV